MERDTGNAVPGNDAASLALGAAMSQAATDYTTLSVVLGPIYSSDYMPFEARGWVTVGAYEGEGNPHYHQTSDDVGTLDYGYLTQVTRMILATLLQALPGGPVAAGDDMQPGEVLLPGQSISSAQRALHVRLSGGRESGAVWAGWGAVGVEYQRSAGRGDHHAGRREPGDLWSQRGLRLGQTPTFNHPGARLVVQDDGNVVIYAPDGTALWATNTAIPGGPVAAGDDMQPGEVLYPGQSISCRERPV